MSGGWSERGKNKEETGTEIAELRSAKRKNAVAKKANVEINLKSLPKT